MRVRFFLPIFGLSVLASCGSGGSTTPTTVTVLGYTVIITSAPPTTAQVGTSIPIAFKATENESDGTSKPASGKSMTVAVTAGGGTIGGAPSTTLTTGADGSVSTTWVLGSIVGTQTIRGSVSSTQYLDVNVTATALPATQMVVGTQPAATSTSGVVLTRQPTVQLKDASGNNSSQSGVPVTASIATGGGTLGGTLTVNSDANGLVTFGNLSLSGVTGIVTLSFSATLNGSTVAIVSQGIAVSPPPATQLAIVVQPAATASQGVVLIRQPTIQLKDASGANSSLAGVPVTVSVASGGGTVGGTVTVSSDVTGLVTFTSLSLNGFAGNVTLLFSAVLNGQGASVTSAAVAVALPPITSVVLTGSQRDKIGVGYTYTVTARLADGTIVQRPVTWSILVPGTATVTQAGFVVPLATGAIGIVSTIDGVAWVGTTTGYDWTPVIGTGVVGTALLSDASITNRFGTAEFPTLLIGCSNGTFVVAVTFTGIITANGQVAYNGDNGTIISDTWLESSPNFNQLTYAGSTNLLRKNFALALATNNGFTFAFGEFQSVTHATSWRLAGMSAAINPSFTACPSNALRSGVPESAVDPVQQLVDAFRAGAPVTSQLEALRGARAAAGPTSGAFPTIQPALRAPDVIPMHIIHP